jgi:hypothetical protein
MRVFHISHTRVQQPVGLLEISSDSPLNKVGKTQKYA